MDSRASLLALVLVLAVSCAGADIVEVAGKVLNVAERVIQGAKSLLQELKANQTAEAASATTVGPPPLLPPLPPSPPQPALQPQPAVVAANSQAAVAAPSMTLQQPVEQPVPIPGVVVAAAPTS